MWKRLANTDTADPLTTTTNCCERKMLFAWLWCPCRGPLKSPPITIWTTQCSFCLQPFSLLLKWRWKPTGEEIKSLKKKNSKTATLRWETGLVDIDSNSLCTRRLLHVFFFLRPPFAIHQLGTGVTPPPAFRKGAALAMSDCCRAA